jgi:hypothetical protein
MSGDCQVAFWHANGIRQRPAEILRIARKSPTLEYRLALSNSIAGRRFQRRWLQGNHIPE